MDWINSMKNLDNIIWHDGVLVETRMECHHTEYNFILTAELYVDEFTAGRERKRFEFTGVEHLSQVMDIAELIDNQNAGNIKDAVIVYKAKKYEISLHLFGGFLNFIFKTMRVVDNEFE
ncbi:hypothetical protein ECZU26_39460 [Escherichia coli]|jgi:hypothetical protein|nr:hypothetical protein TUM1886_27080 [Escherichia coli]GHL33121.1 hypothetical protein ECZU26_39460 [Escherichia coli]